MRIVCKVRRPYEIYHPLVDLASPYGVFDLADITGFIDLFVAGCG